MHTHFKPSLFFKRLSVLGVLALAAVSAQAHNDDRSFEDNLKNPWSQPASSFHVDHHDGRGWGHVQYDWHFIFKHHPWGGWGEHGGGAGSGNGGIGGVSPIPEPQSQLMLLAGLVMIAALVRRKSR